MIHQRGFEIRDSRFETKGDSDFGILPAVTPIGRCDRIAYLDTDK
jgi:hypothetical protein